jgi:hypothetical protein
MNIIALVCLFVVVLTIVALFVISAILTYWQKEDQLLTEEDTRLFLQESVLTPSVEYGIDICNNCKNVKIKNVGTAFYEAKCSKKIWKDTRAGIFGHMLERPAQCTCFERGL